MQANEKTAKGAQGLKHVGECLYRTPAGIYVALVKVRGKQIKRSLKTSDPTLAKRRLSDLRTKAKRMHGKETRDVQFDELAQQWLESIKSGLKKKSLDRRKVSLVGLTPFFSGKPLRSIGFSSVEKWQRKRGSKISARSHNIELETLKLIFEYAMKRGVILDNPTHDFKRRKQPKAVVQMPTKEEFAAVIEELRASKQATASGAGEMVEFLAYSGMRVGEAREIRFRDVNLSLGSVKVTGGENLTKNHQERSVPLFPALRELLVRIMEHRGTVNPNERLFAINSPRGALDTACKRAGVKMFNVHSLRHFFASNAIEKGINFAAIAGWLGHSDGGTLVARTYGHLRQEFSEQMALRMNFTAAPNSEATPKFSVVAARHAA
jgi:integrase